MELRINTLHRVIIKNGELKLDLQLFIITLFGPVITIHFHPPLPPSRTSMLHNILLIIVLSVDLLLWRRYSWNYVDRIISGSTSEFGPNLKYWRMQFTIIPQIPPPPTRMERDPQSMAEWKDGIVEDQQGQPPQQQQSSTPSTSGAVDPAGLNSALHTVLAGFNSSIHILLSLENLCLTPLMC